MVFHLPTLLQVKGENDNGHEEIWYAEAVGKMKKDGESMYEAYYLIPDRDEDGYLVYDDTFDYIPVDSVMCTHPVHDDYVSAWFEMGLIYKPNGKFLIIGSPREEQGEVEKEDDESEIGSVDTYSTDSDGSDLSDLIDDTEESHGHTCECEYCKDTRLCQTQFNDWIPENESEKNVKNFINSIEERAVIHQDNNMF